MKIFFAILLFTVSAVAAANPTRALDAVGRIDGVKQINADDQVTSDWLGTGWVILNPYDRSDDSYYVITNAHVAEDIAFPTIRLCGSDETLPLEPLVYVTSDQMDVAILRVRGNPRNLPTVRMGDASRLDVNDTVYALGSPRGLDCSATKGIASNVTREGGSTMKLVHPRGNIQTDAPINPGNSGGPLIARQGGKWVVVGMNTYIYRESDGLGFAMPVDVVKKVFMDYRARGEVRIGTMEALYRDLPEDPMTRQMMFGISTEEANRTGFGAWIAKVKDDSSAKAAGLLENDVIASVNGTAVRSANHLMRELAYINADTVSLEVIRNGNRYTINMAVKFETLNNTIPKAEQYPNLTGMLMTAASNAPHLASLRDGLVFPEALQNAVVVTAVAALSPAHEAGVMNGDVIVSARRQSVAMQPAPEFASAADLQRYIEGSSEPVIVEVIPTAALKGYATGSISRLQVVQLKRIAPQFDGGTAIMIASN